MFLDKNYRQITQFSNKNLQIVFKSGRSNWISYSKMILKSNVQCSMLNILLVNKRLKSLLLRNIMVLKMITFEWITFWVNPFQCDESNISTKTTQRAFA